MKIVIQVQNRMPIVKWKGADGFVRAYEHRSLRQAKDYAKQLACRLEIDEYRRELARVAFLNAQPPKKEG